MLRSRFALARTKKRSNLLSVQPEVGQPVSMDRDVVQPNERATTCTPCRHKRNDADTTLSACHGPQHKRPSQGGTVHTHLCAHIFIFYVYIYYMCMYLHILHAHPQAHDQVQPSKSNAEAPQRSSVFRRAAERRRATSASEMRQVWASRWASVL